jgi:hypothetical protein
MYLQYFVGTTRSKNNKNPRHNNNIQGVYASVIKD